MLKLKRNYKTTRRPIKRDAFETILLRIYRSGVTKGTSLNKLIQKLGIKREEVIAMGDSYNDQAMIEFAGLGVAMGNAPDDIKEIANYVTDTNMNDGVAKVVEKFVLKTDVLV